VLGTLAIDGHFRSPTGKETNWILSSFASPGHRGDLHSI
jgi:hypothetical protein